MGHYANTDYLCVDVKRDGKVLQLLPQQFIAIALNKTYGTLHEDQKIFFAMPAYWGTTHAKAFLQGITLAGYKNNFGGFISEPIAAALAAGVQEHVKKSGEPRWVLVCDLGT